MCQFWCRIHGKEIKGKQRRKEGAAHPLHHTCKACHNHTKGCKVDLPIPMERILPPTPTQDELLGLIVDNDTPADENTIITSEDDTIIIDEIKS